MQQDQGTLLEILPKVGDFLTENLKLTLHPNKIFLKTVASGVDFFSVGCTFPITAFCERVPKEDDEEFTARLSLAGKCDFLFGIARVGEWVEVENTTATSYFL